jgi:hypothetical protein
LPWFVLVFSFPFPSDSSTSYLRIYFVAAPIR